MKRKFIKKAKGTAFFVFLLGSLMLYAEDIRIDLHKGILKKANTLGGFIIGKVEGPCDLIAKGGPIRIDTVMGELNAATSAGEIDINEIMANARIKTGGGNIHVRTARGRLYAETYMGEIVIDSAKYVVAKTISGGDIKIYDLQEYADITTLGNILVVMPKAIKNSVICDIKSMEGDITLYIPKDFGANLEVRIPFSQDPTRENRIKSDFSFSELKQRHEENGKYLSISTTFNRGGGKIKVFLSKGNLYIKALTSDMQINPIRRTT